MELGPLYQLVRLQEDQRVGVFHISLYAAVLHLWQRQYFRQPFRVTRRELKRLARIHSHAIYHKVIDDLKLYGYIGYAPSFHPIAGSLVWFP